MIRNYLELAWQQLEKYRLQSLVSIVSLGIGFACFALAAMWIKYETTYDASHRDAERIHFLAIDQSEYGNEGDVTWDCAKVFCDTLFKHCPEIVEQTHFTFGKRFSINGISFKSTGVIDRSFLDFFDIRIIQGTDGFLHPDGGLAITKEKARKFYGDEDPIGKELYGIGQDTARVPITAVVEGIGEHTNIPFDLLYGSPLNDSFYEKVKYAVRLAPQADLADINQRIDTLKFNASTTKTEGGATQIMMTSAKGGFELIPATKFRHRYFYAQMAVQINHIYLFALAGGLLILCGLLNYLTMFVNRLFIRQREIALRTVMGATGRDLTVQFLIEYGLVLVIAFALGFLLIEAALPSFRQLAELPEETTYIYGESLIYMLLVMAVSMLISLPTIGFFRRQALQNSIQSKVGLFTYSNFRKLSTCLQISISLLFFFCTAVMMKQTDEMRNADIGFDRKNIGIVEVSSAAAKGMSFDNVISYNEWKSEQVEVVSNYLKQQPDVTEVLRSTPIFPVSKIYFNFRVSRFDSQQEAMKRIWPETEVVLRNPDLIKERSEFGKINDFDGSLSRFYNLRLIEGRFIEEGDKATDILLNQSAVREFQWDNPIGKEIFEGGQNYRVIGVVKDFMNYGPTTPAKPAIILKEENITILDNVIVFKYRPGTWKACKESISEHFKQDTSISLDFKNVEEEYEKLLESEKNLQKLLLITAGTCILIALFGVWSMIMLTCEQRIKEIAIRKVFGATVKDILDMFFLEYMALQGIAALIAFPVGYACMKPWTENYVVQTEISWWIYVGIFLSVAFLVALCIGWRVWKTATARPAKEICKG